MIAQLDKLTDQEKQDLFRASIGNTNAFNQMISLGRHSRLGTVIIRSYNNISPEVSPILRPLQRGEIKLFSLEDQPCNEEKETDRFKISPWVGWSILFFSVFISALAPAWMAWDIKSQSFTRNSWRYFFQAVMLVPFWLYERRISTPQQNQKIKQIHNILMIFKVALQNVVHYFFFILSAKLTSINHAIFLSNSLVFWNLLIRMYYAKKNKKDRIHEFQKGGMGMVLIGFFLLFFDSVNNPVLEHPQNTQLYLGRSRAVRLFGDILGVFAAFLLTYMEHITKQAGELTSPMLQTALVQNGLRALSLSSMGYFCGGSQISFNPLYGMLGLFTVTNFVKVLYVSIMFGLGLMISNVYIFAMFPAVVIKIAQIIEPLVTSCILHFFGSEDIPSGFTCIGFSFMIPGMLMIIAGRNAILQVPIKFQFNLFKLKD